MTEHSFNTENYKRVNEILRTTQVSLARTRSTAAEVVQKHLTAKDVEYVIACGDSSQRTDMCSVLAELKLRKFASILIHLLKQDESACVRHEAAFALGQIANPDTLEDIIEAALGDLSVLVRHEAALALPYFKGERVRETLVALCQDQSEDVRESVQIALLQLDRSDS